MRTRAELIVWVKTRLDWAHLYAPHGAVFMFGGANAFNRTAEQGMLGT